MASVSHKRRPIVTLLCLRSNFPDQRNAAYQTVTVEGVLNVISGRFVRSVTYRKGNLYSE